MDSLGRYDSTRSIVVPRRPKPPRPRAPYRGVMAGTDGGDRAEEGVEFTREHGGTTGRRRPARRPPVRRRRGAFGHRRRPRDGTRPDDEGDAKPREFVRSFPWAVVLDAVVGAATYGRPSEGPLRRADATRNRDGPIERDERSPVGLGRPPLSRTSGSDRTAYPPRFATCHPHPNGAPPLQPPTRGVRDLAGETPVSPRCPR